ncbi:hypothetical protein SEA_REYNAULD_21 [Rhodococcus phage Reynauld]|uniref:Uncharacterized protein n=1 Tax=Rhodococcus phage Reynauld TaxID=3062845 RepID=A0ACD4UIC0_9CAUD|nr:hypothetical protein SEA_REYNAULD_21 [Rhodococcus phage Reynauld]
MPIRPNPNGKSATVKKTGVTGGPSDTSSARRRLPPLAQPTPRVAPRLPSGNKPGGTGGRTQ